MERLNNTLADMLSMYVSDEHREWETTLPFLRFAYNSIHQETTWKSPFYLMHRRHPIRPVDAIYGAEPNSIELVSVETVSPGNYEQWMLGNLQRAFAEVDADSQVSQSRYKRNYDVTRLLAEIFVPGQKVLVYRPVIKMRRAEKLLHR